jgi:hypothetical protein
LSQSVESKYYEKNCKRICKTYRGKWIAILGKKIIASGKGITEMHAKTKGETPLVMFIPENEVQLL